MFEHYTFPLLYVPFQRTAHLFSVIPANDTMESMFGHQNVSSPAAGIKSDNLAAESSMYANHYATMIFVFFFVLFFFLLFFFFFFFLFKDRMIVGQKMYIKGSASRSGTGSLDS